MKAREIVGNVAIGAGLLALVLAVGAGLGYLTLGTPAERAQVDMPTPAPTHSFDLGSDWERCLAAMEAAHIPGWMWECRETPDQAVPPTREAH